jgi:sulfate transport system permease protein
VRVASSAVNVLGKVRRSRGVLPGFKLTLGITLVYLSVLVLLPLGALLLKTSSMTWEGFVSAVTGPRAYKAYQLTFGASFVAATVNLFLGGVVAWVLARYQFRGKALLDALVDLPFALPTAVAGIALTTVYAPNGWLGRFLEPLGFRIVYTPWGVIIALIFVGLPFVVRTVEPILQDADPAAEEAAAVLGAGKFRTFVQVILPPLYPALMTGFALSFARAVGEYGSVVFISGNMPLRTEIVPLLIVTKLEQYDYVGATALATVMLLASFFILILINFLQARTRKRWKSV